MPPVVNDAEAAERRRAKKERLALVALLEGASRKAALLGARLDGTIGGLLSVNDTDLRCLDLLNVRGPLSAGVLASELALTTGAVTTVIDRLEKAAYVQRLRGEHDRRAVFIALTPDAAPRIQAFFAALQKEMDKALADYSDTELHFLISFFERMHSATLRSIEKLQKRV